MRVGYEPRTLQLSYEGVATTLHNLLTVIHSAVPASAKAHEVELVPKARYVRTLQRDELEQLLDPRVHLARLHRDANPPTLRRPWPCVCRHISDDGQTQVKTVELSISPPTHTSLSLTPLRRTWSGSCGTAVPQKKPLRRYAG